MPQAQRRNQVLVVALTLPLLAVIAITAARPEFLPAPLPVVVVGALLYSAASIALVAWLRRRGLLVAVETEEPATPSTLSRVISSLHRPLTRRVLKGIQYSAIKLAHRGLADTKALRAYHPWDVLIAKRLSEEIEDGGALLDVGCGNGHRLHEVVLFRDLKSARGVDVWPADPKQSVGGVELTTFDGQNLPFEDKSIDVTMICYVLHHLHPEHASHMMHEAVRVASKKIIVLEDSLPCWTKLYRMRNWAHRVEADVEYGGASDTYKRTKGQAMFLTHDEWLSYFSNVPGVRKVSKEVLYPPMKYRHHTMFILELE